MISNTMQYSTILFCNVQCNRLSAATEAAEASMDLLQAEIGSMSRTGDQTVLKVDKVQADLTIHKAGGNNSFTC